MFDYELLRSKLRNERISRNLTLDEMSQLLSIQPDNLNHIELGDSKPTTEVLINFLNILGIDYKDLESDKLTDNDNNTLYLSKIKENIDKMSDNQKDIFIDMLKIISESR